MLTELRLGFDRNPPSNILKLDQLKKIYLLHNTGISGTPPCNIGSMTGLMDMEQAPTSLHGNNSSDFGLIKDLHYLGMGETHIHGLIHSDMENMHHVK